MESVVSPPSAIATILTAGDFNIGFLADPANVMDMENKITANQAVHGFLSNYVSVLTLLLIENGDSYGEFVHWLASAISPTSVSPEKHGGNAVFSESRWFASQKTEEALLSNPMTACLAILRLNMEKLLLITKPLGEYKTSTEEQKQ